MNYSLWARWAILCAVGFSLLNLDPTTLGASKKRRRKAATKTTAKKSTAKSAKELAALGIDAPEKQPKSVSRLDADEYIALEELDPLPTGVIEFGRGNAANLFHEQGKRPYVYLKGRVQSGTKVSFDGQVIEPDGNDFTFKFSIPPFSKTIPVKIAEEGSDTRDLPISSSLEESASAYRFASS